MEGRLERDFGIVQAIGIEFYLGSFGTAAEEVDRPALANHLRGPYPGVWTSYCFNHDIRAASCRRKQPNRINRIFCGGSVYDFVRAHSARGANLSLAFHHGDHVASHGLRHMDEHQSDGAASDYGNRVADLHAGLVQSTENACQ